VNAETRKLDPRVQLVALTVASCAEGGRGCGRARESMEGEQKKPCLIL